MSHNERLEKALKLLMDNGVLMVNRGIHGEMDLLRELKKIVSMLIPDGFTTFTHAQGTLVVVVTWIEEPIPESDFVTQYTYLIRKKNPYIHNVQILWILKGRPTI